MEENLSDLEFEDFLGNEDDSDENWEYNDENQNENEITFSHPLLQEDKLEEQDDLDFENNSGDEILEQDDLLEDEYLDEEEEYISSDDDSEAEVEESELEDILDSNEDELFSEDNEDNLELEEEELDEFIRNEGEAENEDDQFDGLLRDISNALIDDGIGNIRHNNDLEISTMNAEFSAFRDDLAVVTRIGTKGGKRSKRRVRGQKGRPKATASERIQFRRNKQVAPEIKEKLGVANTLYVANEYKEALKLLQEVIKIDPMAYDAWFTMGLIYQDTGHKAKALEVLMLAAHISQYDNELWRKLANMSIEEGLIDQALFCYSRAVQSDKKDYESMKARAELAIKYNRWRIATTCFRQMLKLDPYNLAIANDMVSALAHTGNVKEAIPYFDNALGYHLNNPTDPPQFSYSDINIATELYILKDMYIKAMGSIIRAYKIFNENDYTEWNESDITLDSILKTIKHLPRISNEIFPIEIKIKLGVLLTLLKFDDEAERFFKCLYDLPLNEFHHLYLEAGSMLISKGDVNAGMEFLSILERQPPFHSVELWSAIGSGYEKQLNYYKAIEYYLKAENLDSRSLSVNIALHYLYLKVNRMDIALHYSSVASSIKSELEGQPNKRHRFSKQALMKMAKIAQEGKEKGYEGSTDTEEENNDFDSHGNEQLSTKKPKIKKSRAVSAFLAELKRKNAKKKQMQTKIKRQRIRAKLEANNYALVRKLFNKFSTMPRELCRENLKKARLYTRLVYQLYYEFLNWAYKKEIPIPKNPEVNELKGEVDEKGDLVYLISWEEYLKRDAALNYEVFSVPLKEWVKMYYDAALIMMDSEYYQEANSMLCNIYNLKLFKNHLRLRQHFLMLNIAIYEKSRDLLGLFNVAKSLLRDNMMLYRNNPYNLYTILGSTSMERMSAMYNPNFSKFSNRLITYFKNQYLENKPLLFRDKSYKLPLTKDLLISALHFQGYMHHFKSSFGYSAKCFLLTIELDDQRPDSYFGAGLSYLNMSMQRTTPNRHIQILQAFTMFFKYAKLAKNSQEANYNLGRAFHSLNLINLAIRHYCIVLNLSDLKSNENKNSDANDNDCDYDLKYESAYNLSLIYHYQGNHQLADYYRSKYLTI